MTAQHPATRAARSGSTLGPVLPPPVPVAGPTAPRDPFLQAFAAAAAGARGRDRTRELGCAAMRRIADAGFGALRLPVAAGGGGLGLEAVVALVVELAEHDASLAQAWRTHIVVTERFIRLGTDAERDRWWPRLVRGDVIGGAWTDAASAPGRRFSAEIRRFDGGWQLDGRKYYSTGALFAEWIEVAATTPDGVDVVARIPSDAPGLTLHDDWVGFGQRTTASGTTVFDGVVVPDEDATTFAAEFRGTPALGQVLLLAVLAGCLREAASVAVAARDRAGVDPASAEGSVLAEDVGAVVAAAVTAEHLVLAATRAVDALPVPTPDDALADAERVVHAAQVAVVEGALAAARRLRRVVPEEAVGSDGSDGSDGSLADDAERIWRNVRTVSSHNPVAYRLRVLGL